MGDCSMKGWNIKQIMFHTTAPVEVKKNREFEAIKPSNIKDLQRWSRQENQSKVQNCQENLDSRSCSKKAWQSAVLVR